MAKRTISWLLCLMMVVSLFAGTLTSASAASLGVTASPASAVIDGTGSAEFTAGTILDTFAEMLNNGEDFDLGEFVKGLTEEGFSLEAITALLDNAGFNWEDILGALQENGIDIAQIAEVLKGLMNGDEVNFEDVVADLLGNSDLLSELMGALEQAGFSSELFQTVLDSLKNGDTSALLDLIGALIGNLTQNSTALPMAEGSEPEADASLISVDALMEALKSVFGDAITPEVEAALQQLIGSLDQIEMPDAVKNIQQVLGDNNIDLQKIIETLMAATNGEADYTEIIKSVLENVSGQIDMEEMAKAFSDALGTDLDLTKLAEALMSAMDNGFNMEDLMKALGEQVNVDELIQAITDKLNVDSGDLDVAALVKALTEALQEQDIKNFDLEKFAEAMGQDFDVSAFLKSIVDKLSDGKIDTDAVKAAIEDALGEQVDLASLIDALKNGMGEDFDMSKLLEALMAALQSSGMEIPSLDSLLASISEAMGLELSEDQLADLVQTLTDLFSGDMEFKDILDSLLNGLQDKVDLDTLLAALSDVFGDDFGGKLKEILQSLLGEGFDLNDIIEKLKNFDFDPQTILDLLFGSEIAYQWNVRTADGAAPVVNDKNTYEGANAKTLKVTRSEAPEKDETYTYFCTVNVFGTDMDSSDAVLTIKAPGSSEDPDPVKPTPDPVKPTPDPVKPTPDPVEPTPDPVKPDPDVPVLDNEKHNAYINGYEDGTVRPNNEITRAEISMILFRLMTDESRSNFKTTANSFSDVKAGSWYNEAVSTLAKAQVLKGYPDGSFKPGNPITRAELATVLTRLSVLVNLKADVSPKTFSDVKGHWAEKAIGTAADNGWIAGYENGTFRPDNHITRAETVTMINRMLSRNPEGLKDIDGMRTFSDNMNPAAWYYIAIQEAANGHTYTRNDKGVESWTGLTQ